jgi:hypothetical protein
METDPASLDPEERQNKFFALMSVALGLLSLCAAIVPYCGGGMSLLGIVLGLIGRKSENYRMAVVGVGISTLGLLIAITYAIFVFIAGSPD